MSTHLTPQFDKDLQEEVLLVPHSKTGEIQKFVYNTETNTFEIARQVVKIQDLRPLHMSHCKRFSEIIFCRNEAKNGQVFKYFFETTTQELRRVQCTCCEFWPESEGYFFKQKERERQWSCGSILELLNFTHPELNDIKEIVDEENHNYIWLNILYSTFCESKGKVLIVALKFLPNDDNRQDVLRTYHFDPETETFQTSYCACRSCCFASYEDQRMSAFEFGSQGAAHRRTHRDRQGHPLVCLSMRKVSNTLSVMDIFSDRHGRIGRYVYNEELECFDLEELLDVRVHEHLDRPELVRKRPELRFDDKLRCLYEDKCSKLKCPIFFCSYFGDPKARKYVFNKSTLQFELVKCSDCKFEQKKIFRSTLSSKDQKTVVTLCQEPKEICLSVGSFGRMKKLMKSDEEGWVEMEKAPIKYMKHFNPEDYLAHQPVVFSKSDQPSQVFLSDGTEKWKYWSYFLVGMDGTVEGDFEDEADDESDENDETDTTPTYSDFSENSWHSDDDVESTSTALEPSDDEQESDDDFVHVGTDLED